MATYRERAVLIVDALNHILELGDSHLMIEDLAEFNPDDWYRAALIKRLSEFLEEGAREEREFIADERRKEREEKAAAKVAAKAAKAGLHPVIEDVVIDGVAVSR